MRVRPLLLLAAASLTASAVVATPVSAAGPSAGSGGRFIVTVADAYDSRSVAAEHRRKGVEVDYVYSHALNGFAGQMSEAELGELQRDRRVTRIERDGVVTTTGTQADATWGLDRIDQRSGTNGTYTYTPTGLGVHAYVIDTGIRSSHTDFGGRVTTGFTSIADDGGTEDCNGHGTHVAGTVGGTVYGVAKQVRLVPVRVLDCAGSGTWSGVIAGVDWVTANHVKPAVANMSLGGGASTSVDDAVAAASNAGVTMVVAAGNGDRSGRQQDACNYSPARLPEAVTIGATTSTDAKTSWSNYGSCVDLFAPGASITSAWYTGDTALNTISGTSMAAPHVAGVAALHLQGAPGASPQQVRDTIYNTSTKGVVTSSSTANNHLVYSPLTAEETTNAAPIASFTATCQDLVCTFDGSGSKDSDGSISSYAWNFGDGTSASGVSVSRTYATAGTYTVMLTVTDGAGATGTSSQPVEVTSSDAGTEPTTGITLTATPAKVKGSKALQLDWTNASSGSVNIYVDAAKPVLTDNDGTQLHTIGGKGGGSHTVWICEAVTDGACSPKVVVTF